MSEVRLTADAARDISYARQDAFDRTLAIIRNMVDTQIKDSARQGSIETVVEVPRTVFGREPYNTAFMGKALASQLHGDGFSVSGTCTRLKVSWAPSGQPLAAPAIVVPVPKRQSSK